MEQTEFSKEIMRARYTYPGETEWDDVAKRVSRHISSIEADNNVQKYKQDFYNTISTGDFIPGGRILYGAGRAGTGLMNCFALEFEDNRHSVANVMSDTYLISTAGGGVGINVSNIRPKGDPIRGIDAAAPGVISEMKKIDAIGEQVRTGGNRRAALLSLLDISHPDSLEFIDIKLDTNTLTNHNISLGITNEFIKAVKKNKTWTFSFNNKEYKLWKFIRKNPDKRYKEIEVLIPAVSKESAILIAPQFYKDLYTDYFEFVEETVLNARDLWQKIVDRNMKSGEPGFLFVDNIKKYFNNQYFQKFSAPNPCLTRDTIINTNLGKLTLEEVINRINNKEKIQALSYDIETKENEYQQISWGSKTRDNTDIIEIELDNGEKLKLTPDHKVFTENRGYIEAANLTEEDIIIINKE